ncbi:hypothetical protein SAMN02745673_02461 [Marinactinospora thermotolerans DSM 45154]|uniref:Uncharacterized protein n=1 Tax=Marinactinospora thermotolerans DSM 45154 TaxID=1122192 RepID=A0A1T4R357_9ACTN|nr:hypothetical protein SAMN02745673_02461 [Marinactinospora thermotolerans DSM 45154]
MSIPPQDGPAHGNLPSSPEPGRREEAPSDRLPAPPAPPVVPIPGPPPEWTSVAVPGFRAPAEPQRNPVPFHGAAQDGGRPVPGARFVETRVRGDAVHVDGRPVRVVAGCRVAQEFMEGPPARRPTGGPEHRPEAAGDPGRTGYERTLRELHAVPLPRWRRLLARTPAARRRAGAVG